MAIVLTGCPGSQVWNDWQEQQAEAEFRAHPPEALAIWYEGSSGIIGHYLTAQPQARCGETWQTSASLVAGRLPPGLDMDDYGIVTGTPQQPGIWVATVRFGDLGCRGKAYPSQEVNLRFDIKGDAVPGIR